MGWKHFVRITLLSIVFILETSAETQIVPKPKVDVESVTSYSITLNWTIPVNSTVDSYSIEVHTSHNRIQRITTSETRAVIEDLNPGYLYTFLLTSMKGRLESEIRVILQDTVPLPPKNLRLDHVRELSISYYGVFGFAKLLPLKVNGIEAAWEQPREGVCECFVASISPSDGRVSRSSAEKSQIYEGSTSVITSRRFLSLVPGRTYNVSVQSSTCGNGFKGPLRSRPVRQTTTLPPADPPPVMAVGTTDSYTYLSWEGGDIVGFYDDFLVILVTTTDESSDVTIEMPEDPRTRGRNVTGLTPCTNYGFEVYTLNKRLRSRNSQAVEVYTKPTPPTQLMVIGFDETSISIRWRRLSNHEISGFQLTVEGYMSRVRPVAATTATITALTPGILYDISVTSQCLGPDRTDSLPARITQTTAPLPPEEMLINCSMPPRSHKKRSSIIVLTWFPPVAGNWDGFVVEYSPYEFNRGFANPTPPVSLERHIRSLSISVPVTGRVVSVQVRSVMRHVLSDALSAEVFCLDHTGNAIRQCRERRQPIRITIFNSTHLEIEVTVLPLKNVTVQLSITPRQEEFVTKEHKFVIVNPCNFAIDARLLHVIVYPECNEGSVCAPVMKRLCRKTAEEGQKPTPTPAPAGSRRQQQQSSAPPESSSNACCHETPYHTSFYRCCHGKLRAVEENTRCCYTKWYDPTTQRCCGRTNGKGSVVPTTFQCS